MTKGNPRLSGRRRERQSDCERTREPADEHGRHHSAAPRPLPARIGRILNFRALFAYLLSLCVCAFYLGAVQLDRLLIRHVADSDGQTRLTAAVDARASTEVEQSVLLEHRLQSPRGEDESRVDESEQILCVVFDHLLLVVREHLSRLDVEDHVERVVEVGNQILKARQVEAVLSELGLNLAEQLIACRQIQIITQKWKTKIDERASETTRQIAARNEIERQLPVCLPLFSSSLIGRVCARAQASPRCGATFERAVPRDPGCNKQTETSQRPAADGRQQPTFPRKAASRRRWEGSAPSGLAIAICKSAGRDRGRAEGQRRWPPCDRGAAAAARGGRSPSSVPCLVLPSCCILLCLCFAP